MKAASVRDKIKLNKKYTELTYWKSILGDTQELFYAYDLELADFVNQVADTFGEKTNLNAEASSNKDLKEESLVKFEEKIENKKSDYARNSCEEDLHEERFELDLENKKAPSWMKKAFKAIALKTHPDKVIHREDLSAKEKAELVKIYSQAADAVASSSGISLIEIAQSLDIEIELSPKQQILMLENKIDKIKKEVESHQQMISWSWGENEGNVEIRANLFLHVLSHLKMDPIPMDKLKKMIEKFESGDNLVEKLASRDKILKRKVGQRPAPGIGRTRKK